MNFQFCRRGSPDARGGNEWEKAWVYALNTLCNWPLADRDSQRRRDTERRHFSRFLLTLSRIILSCEGLEAGKAKSHHLEYCQWSAFSLECFDIV